jgi:hypothetical protein
MAFNINLFAGALKLGGARTSLFQVNITNPANGAADIQVPFLARAAQIPAATIAPLDVPYFGRQLRLAGNRTFADWTATIINDEDMQIRNAMEEWSNSINGFQDNLRKFGASSPALYKSTAQVTQFSKTGVPVRVYNMVGIFPTEISAIEMDWGTDAVSEFTCTFTYDYWEVSGGITGNAGGA